MRDNSVPPKIPKIFSEGIKKTTQLEFTSFNEIVEIVVDAEAKTAVRPRPETHEIDKHCDWNNHLAVTKSYTQSYLIKDFRIEKWKTQFSEFCTSEYQHKTSQKTCTDQKQKGRRYNREQRQQIGSLAATEVQSIEIDLGQKQKKDKYQNLDRMRDVSKVKCFNCQKLSHYSNKCPNQKN